MGIRFELGGVVKSDEGLFLGHITSDGEFFRDPDLPISDQEIEKDVRDSLIVAMKDEPNRGEWSRRHHVFSKNGIEYSASGVLVESKRMREEGMWVVLVKRNNFHSPYVVSKYRRGESGWIQGHYCQDLREALEVYEKMEK